MILHIDMDAFYAAVEQRDRPELRGKCLIVGGRSERGVVTTASYEARRYGVRSAMPMFEARRRCPHAIVIPGRMERYKAVSRDIMALLRDYTPLVEPVSIDEAYLDIGGGRRLFGPPEQIARRIKAGILQSTGLTCSIGGAPLRFLAKIASDIRKPDGLTIIAPEAVPAFIDQLPLAKVPGVGRVAQGHLARMNLATLGDVRCFPETTLVRRLGKFGRRLAALARGEDPTPVTPHTPAKSISSESTLAVNTADRGALRDLMREHAEAVARQLRRLDIKARTVTLKIKHADFQQVTRSQTLPRPIQAAESVFTQAEALFDAYTLRRPVRLIGVGTSHFVPAAAPVQADLFPVEDQAAPNWEKVDHTLDAIHAKFGRTAIRKASQVKTAVAPPPGKRRSHGD